MLPFLAIVFYILRSAEIKGMFPFAQSFYSALIYYSFNPIIVGIPYIAASLFVDFSIGNFIDTMVFTLVFTLVKILHFRFKRDIPLKILPLYIILAKSYSLYSSLINPASFINFIVSLVISLLFSFICVYFIQAIAEKRLNENLNTDDFISLALMTAVFFLGLSTVHVYTVPIVIFVYPFLLMLLLRIFDSRFAMIFGIMAGLGVSLYFADSFYLARFALMATAAVLFKNNKILASTAIAATAVMSDLFLNENPNTLLFFAVGVAALIPACFIPVTAIRNITINKPFSSETEINDMRRELRDKLINLSCVYKDMYNFLTEIDVNTNSAEENAAAIARSCDKIICYKCKYRELCQNATGTDGIKGVIMSTYQYEKISPLNIPPSFYSSCPYINQISEEINSKKKFMRPKEQTSHLLRETLAGQYLIIADMFKSLSADTGEFIYLEREKQKTLFEQFFYANIPVKDLMVYQKKSSTVVSLELSEDYSLSAIEKIASETLKTKMTAESMKKSGLTYNLTLSDSLNYDVVFGFAGISKKENEMSGDTHSFTKINKNKFMMALCDGMGSGERAGKTSAGTIAFIESLYKSDFTDDMVLKSVNSLLITENSEVFTAADIATFDLTEGECCFIKIASPPCYIRKKDKIKLLSGAALPLGITEEFVPTTIKTKLDSGDMVILISDGVYDAFEYPADLEDFMLSLTTQNPQIFAENILKCALDRTGIPKDDMTVLCARLFNNI